MIISNMFAPLVGIVDTAIVGHLPGTHHLAGVALGGIIITQLIWVCGFLRMAATGLSAEAKGSGDTASATRILVNSLFISLFIGIIVLILQKPLFDAGVMLSDSNDEVITTAAEYFYLRINFLPVALLNLSISGWMLGQQWHRDVMTIQIGANFVNIVLSYVLAIHLSLGVWGVALATVVAELAIFLSSLVLIRRREPAVFKGVFRLPDFRQIKGLISLNTDMFIRNITLQFCLAVITFTGLQHGELTAATNAVLMQFFVLIALGLDGVAYAVEALIGESKGQKNNAKMRQWMFISIIWSNIFALFYTCVFWFFFSSIAALMTNIPELQNNMLEYRWYIIFLPIVAHWCFTLDGIYIGLMQAKVMRNTMLLSAVLSFSPLLLVIDNINNHLIWIVFSIFLFIRGVSLGGHLGYTLSGSR